MSRWLRVAEDETYKEAQEAINELEDFIANTENELNQLSNIDDIDKVIKDGKSARDLATDIVKEIVNRLNDITYTSKDKQNPKLEYSYKGYVVTDNSELKDKLKSLAHKLLTELYIKAYTIAR